jgi:hypothetical protein
MAAKTPVERRTVQEMRTTTVTKPFIIEFIINSLLFKPFKTKLQTPNDATNAQHFGSRTIWDMHQAPPLFLYYLFPPVTTTGLAGFDTQINSLVHWYPEQKKPRRVSLQQDGKPPVVSVSGK